MTDLIASSAQAAAQAAAETAAEAAVKKALQATEFPMDQVLAVISTFNTTQQQTRDHAAEDSRKVALLHEEVNRMQIKVDQLQSQNDSLHEQLQVTQSGHEDSIRQLEELRATRRGCTTGEATRPLERDNRALELELEQLRKKLQDQEKALGRQQVAATRQVTGADKEKHATQQQLQEHWQHIGALEEQLRQERLISNVATPADFLKMSKASEKENTSHENNKLKLDNARLKSDLDRCLDKLRAHEGGASNALRWGKVGGG
jgi:hypothetical protein